MVNWILATHAYQCKTKAGNYPQRISDCIMYSVPTSTVPGAKTLHHTNRAEGLQVVADIDICFRQISKVTTAVILVGP